MSQDLQQPGQAGSGPDLTGSKSTGASVLHLKGTEFFQHLE